MIAPVEKKVDEVCERGNGSRVIYVNRQRPAIRSKLPEPHGSPVAMRNGGRSIQTQRFNRVYVSGTARRNPAGQSGGQNQQK